MAGTGGVRKGAGRKPKVAEVALLKMMDDIMDCNDLWKKIADKALEGCVHSQKMWLEYRYGKPRQQVDVTSDGKSVNSLPPTVTVTIVTPKDED